MPVITRLELENAQRDVTDLGKVVNGSATLPNPSASAPNNVGTVTTREGQIIKTLSKLVADGFTSVEARLKPIIYSSTTERIAALDVTGNDALQPGQTCYDKEDTNLYIVDEENQGEPPVLTKLWRRLSNLELAAAADLGDVLRGLSDVAKLSVKDYRFLKEREKVLAPDAFRYHHIEVPIKSTLNEGLAKALGYNSPPATHFAQPNVGYGCRIPFGELINVSLTPVGEFPEWIAATKRVMMRNNNPNELIGYYIPGYVEINGSYEKTVWMRDCWVDPNYGAYQAIGKNNYDVFPVYVEYCTLRRFLNEAAAPNYGHVAFCDIELSRGDALKASGHDVYFHGNMMRLLGQDLPSTHADGIQVWDCSRLQITQNTIYMPGTATAWDEGTYGSTQCIRLVTEASTGVLEEVYVAGNVIIGGGFTIAVRSRFVGSLVQNVVIANNIIGGTENSQRMYVYGPIAKDHWLSNNPGTIRNLIFWNNRMHDGTSFATEVPPTPQAGPDQNGIWHYDKTYASPEFLECGKRFGLLDWNGDLAPGVTNRTTS